MNKKFFTLLFALLWCTIIVAQINEVDPIGETNTNIVDVPGDILFTWDIDALTGETGNLGVEYAFGYLWVTSRGLVNPMGNVLWKIDVTGGVPTVVDSFAQGTTSAWGWRDLCNDGTFLYASDSDTIVQIDPTTGLPTGVSIPGPISPSRALAYDPATDHFWTASFTSDLYEFDRTGAIINQFPSATSMYGAGWDNYSADGPWLWVHGDPNSTVSQVNPVTGTLTGLSYVVSATGSDGGMSISADDLVPGKIVAVCLTQEGPPDNVYVVELGDYSSAGGILLIDDDLVAADSVEAWLNVLGQTYTRMDDPTALAMPTMDWVNNYDAVLYIGTTSTGAQLDSCTAYVANGGNLLVMDNDEGYFYGTSTLFMDYLMAEYVSDAGSQGVLTGLEMMAGVNPDISGDPFPDDALPYTGAYGTGVPIFKAPTDTTYTGFRADGGTFRTALLLWDADYTDPSYATTIFDRVIKWLVDAIVPVELTSFTAEVNETDVTLNWVTASEINNQGFEIERNSGYGFEKIGYVAGFGTSSETHTYSFEDASLNEGTYSYRLKQVDLDGSFEYSDVVEVDVTVPDVYALQQNYPNPFNPSTKIDFSLAIDSKVNLKVFDILGQEVATLINTDLVAGSHSVDFDASLLTSGVYIYRMEATGINGTNFTSVKKMILTK